MGNVNEKLNETIEKTKETFHTSKHRERTDASPALSAPAGGAPAGAPRDAGGNVFPESPGAPAQSPAAPSQSQASRAPAGLKHIDFINIIRKDYTARIELLQGPVEGLSKADETDLLIVYLRERGVYKGNRDSALAALNRSGISLAELEKSNQAELSYRRYYNCWLSGLLPAKVRPAGFEYKRLLVYEDPGEELTKDDNIPLDIMKCLATVLGGKTMISSVMIPLSGALLSPSLRKHYIRAAVEICYAWISMGLPIRDVRILLPEVDITKDIETFAAVKQKVAERAAAISIGPSIEYDVVFSYASADKDAATMLMDYVRSKNPAIRILDGEAQEMSVRERGGVMPPYLEVLQKSQAVIALLTDEYFRSVVCTEAFSLAYCKHFESQGNFLIPIFWKSCDLTPLAKRLVNTVGRDCREASFEAAKAMVDDLLTAFSALPMKKLDDDTNADSNSLRGDPNLNIGDMVLMNKGQAYSGDFDEDMGDDLPEESMTQMFFNASWQKEWEIDFKQIIFGPRIGAGGFGEVYKAKYKNQIVAVKVLLPVDSENPDDAFAEFMVETRLMSMLKHPNIVQFIGASIHRPNVSLVLEFLPGGSLWRAIHRRKRNEQGPFPTLKLLYIAWGIAKGMAYLHAQDPVIIHRDLKSPNILLGTNVNEVKVTDFGLARLRVATFVKTGAGGTPEWMAPEMMRQEPFDERSDVYSFGVILWELLVCEKPWRDDHPMQIVFKVGSRGEHLSLPKNVEALPELKQMVSHCLQNRSSDRPSFEELATALGKLVETASRRSNVVNTT